MEACSNCGASFRTKYMIIRCNDSNSSRTHYEATSKRSLIGWLKSLVDNFPFEQIEILNLMTECPLHEKHFKSKL